MRLGFVGLGDQGAPIAGRLIDAGYAMTLWARRPESLADFSDTSAQTVHDLRMLAEAADFVGVCVRDDAGVREVCEALIPHMASGGMIAIHSTVHPQTCRDLAAKAAARGLSLVDAPVSGGNAGARAGRLTVMVGGSESDFAACRDIFSAFGELIVRVGDVGAGQMAKLVNNTLMAANAALAHHALEAGRTLGLDRDGLARIVNASSGRSFGFEAYARTTRPADFGFAAALLEKDVRLLADCLPGEGSFEPLAAIALPFLTLVKKDAEQD